MTRRAKNTTKRISTIVKTERSYPGVQKVPSPQRQSPSLLYAISRPTALTPSLDEHPTLLYTGSYFDSTDIFDYSDLESLSVEPPNNSADTSTNAGLTQQLDPIEGFNTFQGDIVQILPHDLNTELVSVPSPAPAHDGSGILPEFPMNGLSASIPGVHEMQAHIFRQQERHLHQHMPQSQHVTPMLADFPLDPTMSGFAPMPRPSLCSGSPEEHFQSSCHFTSVGSILRLPAVAATLTKHTKSTGTLPDDLPEIVALKERQRCPLSIWGQGEGVQADYGLVDRFLASRDPHLAASMNIDAELADKHVAPFFNTFSRRVAEDTIPLYSQQDLRPWLCSLQKENIASKTSKGRASGPKRTIRNAVILAALGLGELLLSHEGLWSWRKTSWRKQTTREPLFRVIQVGDDSTRNIDVVRGLKYVSIAMDILHAQKGAETLEHFYANLLVALYFIELCRPLQGYEYINDAAGILERMIRP
jgi:hypothetical protein